MKVLLYLALVLFSIYAMPVVLAMVWKISKAIYRLYPVWWVVESVRYPFIRRRVLRDIATATDEQLERSFRLLFNKNTPLTWFVEKTAMAISEEWSRREGFDIIKEMNRRHEELKRN